MTVATLLSLVLVVPAQGADERPKDEYLYLTSKLTTDGFASSKTPNEGNFDGTGEAFVSDGLPAGRRLTVRSARFGPIVFLRPKTDGTANNMVACQGQSIQVLTKNVFNVILCLGAAHGGSPDGSMELHFDDGTKAKTPFGLSDWKGWPVFGEEKAFELRTVKKRSGTSRQVTTIVRGGVVTRQLSGSSGVSTSLGSIWLQQIPIPRAARLTSITLPNLPGAKILALTLAEREGVLELEDPDALPAPKPAPVAVFAERSFPYFLGLDDLSPDTVRDELAKIGVRAAILSARHLEDTELLTPENFPVLVYLYGNTFPESAADSLRAYRKSGGTLVHSGVPFTHPVRRTAYGAWVDRGHTAGYMSHDGPLAMGTGGFRNVASVAPEPREALNAWKLGDVPWPDLRLGSNRQAPPQGLDPSSLHESDEVTPLLGIAEVENTLAMALIRHGSCDFAGSTDLWTGVTDFHREGDSEPTTLRRELFLRGLVWLLRAKDIVDDATWETAAQPLSPDAIAAKVRAPTFSDKVGSLPPLPAPTASCFYVEIEPDFSKLTRTERVLLATAQGLINRGGDKTLYVVHVPADLAVLRRLEKTGAVENLSKVSPSEVLELLGHRRAIVVDPDVYGSLNLATMIAAVEGLLVAYPGDVAAFNLEVAADLRGLFDSGPEMLAWAIENLRPRMAKEALAFCPPTPENYELRESIVALRLFTLWVPVWAERSAPGIFPPREEELVEQVLGETAVGTPVLGAIANSNAQGLSANDGRRLLSKYGKPYVPTAGLTNLSFYPRIKGGEPLPRPAPREIQVDKGKIYLACVRALLPGQFLHAQVPRSAPVRSAGRRTTTRVPLPVGPTTRRTRPATPRLRMGYSLSRPLLELMPGQARLVLSSLEGSAVLGSSGGGEIVPAVFGDGFGDARQAVLAAYIQTALRAMEQRGQQFLYLAPGFSLQDTLGAAKFEGTPSEGGIFVAYSSAQSPAPNALTAHYLVGGTPVFHDLGWTQLNQLVTEKVEGSLSSKLLPTFLWTMDTNVRRLEQQGAIGEHVVLVRPDELAHIYRKWRAERDLVETVLVKSGSRWKYNDRGQDLGSRWRPAEYDDAGWPEGAAELGYGDAAEGRPETTVLSFGDDAQAKHPTYYFRKTFEVARGLEFDLLVLEVLADDGCVVHVNGTERFRHNLPEGDIAFDTKAKTALGGSAEHMWRSHVLSPSVLSRGANTLGVEVHQSSASSSDLSFDLRLRAYRWRLRPAPKDS